MLSAVLTRLGKGIAARRSPVVGSDEDECTRAAASPAPPYILHPACWRRDGTSHRQTDSREAERRGDCLSPPRFRGHHTVHPAAVPCVLDALAVSAFGRTADSSRPPPAVALLPAHVSRIHRSCLLARTNTSSMLAAFGFSDYGQAARKRASLRNGGSTRASVRGRAGGRAPRLCWRFRSPLSYESSQQRTESSCRKSWP